MPDPPRAALDAWRHLLGAAAITTGDALEPLLANVTGFSRLVHGALRVTDADQVPAIVGIAREHRVPLYPISTGRNWGLGSRLPVGDGAVIVDLAGLRRIRSLDRTTQTVVVEPGVTQGHLADHLAREAPELVANLTGSAAATSLVGNCLDRGIGYLAERTDDLRGLEIVLGSGETVRMGEWHPAGDHYGPRWSHGAGPSLEALFVQSNLGIVTAAALGLRRRQRASAAFRVPIARDGEIAGLLDGLAELHRDDVLVMPTRVFDGVWMHGTDPGPAWTAFGGLVGRLGVVTALRNEVRATLTDAEFAPVGAGEPPPPSASSWWRSVLSVMAGRPTDLSVANWATRIGVECETADLDASTFGMLCDVRAIPFAGREAHAIVAAARRSCAAHDVRPCVSLSALDAHTLEAVFILLFDRHAARQVVAAHRCADDLGQALDHAGAVPHRSRIDQMPGLASEASAYWRALARIKRSLDPDLIVAPGRYSLL